MGPSYRHDQPGEITGIREAVKEQKKRIGVIMTWVGGVVASLLVAGLCWAGGAINAAEKINDVQDSRLKILEERANEDRAYIRDQFNKQSDKLDRLVERSK